MTFEEKQLLARCAGLKGLTADELDRLLALTEEATATAAQLPILRSDSEPAHVFSVPQTAPRS
jgi:hypothetical protein